MAAASRCRIVVLSISTSVASAQIESIAVVADNVLSVNNSTQEELEAAFDEIQTRLCDELPPMTNSTGGDLCCTSARDVIIALKAICIGHVYVCVCMAYQRTLTFAFCHRNCINETAAIVCLGPYDFPQYARFMY